MKYFVRVDGEEFEVDIGQDGRILLNGEPVDVDLVQVPGQNVYSLLLEHHSYEIAAEEVHDGYTILLMGEQYVARVEDEYRRRLMAGRSRPAPPSSDTAVTAPIPGRIVKVEVREGDEVKDGQPLVILEAMKMENEIRSPRAGTVQRVHVTPGQNVEQGEVLVTLA